MTSHLVAGRPMPDAVAGHVALELCNTKAMWHLPNEREYLTDHTAAVLWAGEHQLVTRTEARRLRALPPATQTRSLRALKSLRTQWYQVLTTGASPDAVHSSVARAVRRASYRPGPAGWRLCAPFTASVIVDRAALSIHDLLTRHGTSAVGVCGGTECGWVFLDPSHRRRWCVMAVCGNRAKARRYTQRHK